MRRFKGPNDVEEAREAVHKVWRSALSSYRLPGIFKRSAPLAFTPFPCPLAGVHACVPCCFSNFSPIPLSELPPTIRSPPPPNPTSTHILSRYPLSTLYFVSLPTQSCCFYRNKIPLVRNMTHRKGVVGAGGKLVGSENI